jgi:hypothetical protein
MRRLQSALAGVRFRYAIYPFPRSVLRAKQIHGPMSLPDKHACPSLGACL